MKPWHWLAAAWVAIVALIVRANHVAHRRSAEPQLQRTTSLRALRKADAAKAKRRNQNRRREMRKRGARC